MKALTYLSAAALMMMGFTAVAQTQMPKVEKPIPGKNVILNKISNNGKWGVSETGSTEDGDLRPRGGYIYDMETYAQTPIVSPSGLAGVSDISDDGNIVVGECDGVPAYWDRRTGEWTKFPVKTVGFDQGRFNAVTPDGRYAVGVYLSSRAELNAAAMAFDLQTGEELELTGMPTLDQVHENKNENALYEISPDGRFMVGMLSQAYLMEMIDNKSYAPLCTYVYDFQEKTYDMIGFIDYADKDWGKKWANLHFIDAPKMSNNGEWVTGMAYMVEAIPGSEWPNEAYHAFRYNTLTKEIEVYSDALDADIAGFSIDNNGVVYGATPAQNPYPTCVVRSGDYFISLDQIFKQVYKYDFTGDSGYTVTGKPLAVSDDGKTIVMLPDTDGCYILKMPEPLAEAAARVKLLGNYSVTPQAGVKLSQFTTFTINFDRNVKVRGNSNKVTLESADGSFKANPTAQNGIVANGKKVTITFRTIKDLAEGMEYTLTIPEGLIRLEGNEDETNEEIKVTYIGRANTPVKPTNIIPNEGSYVATIDATSNPILMTFDAELQVVSGKTAELYRNDESMPFCLLNVAVAGNQALLFPTAGQHLFLDSQYHVVIPAGTLTDVSGGGANEEITFTYEGAYEREVPQGNDVFYDDCSDYNNMMFYEGDKRQPDSEVAGWGFTAETTPWFIVRDDTDTNMAFASHSMYKPAGKSDDWMVTPQLTIPDEKCYLEFLAQNYLFDCQDVLDIYIYPSGNVYNTLTADIVNDIRTKGDHVFSEQLYAGDDESTLAGDWGEYKVDLSKYAGQDIYIAFVNQNNNQSAIFIDDIRVAHDIPVFVEFDTPERVVKQETAPVSGTIFFDSEMTTYNSLKLVLTDAEGTAIDTIEDKGLNLTKGSQYPFKFTKELPLILGETTTYYVETSFDGGDVSKITGKVANLTFQPNRRIVLEEYTGSECGNCPLGIRGMENIESLYPGVMIPITIRTYQSDRLGTGMGAYSQALGLDQMGAPSAIIDRREFAYPMISVEGDYRFSGAGIPNDNGGEERVWLDVFRSRYETPAEVGLHFTSTLDENARTAKVNLYIANALNQHRAAYKVFAVVTEDGLSTYQKNYLSTVTDPDLGEWGAGGKYATPLVMPVEAHGVARQTWGTTYKGTAGCFPSEMKAGKGYTTEFTVTLPETIQNFDNCNMVVMILDATDRVLNANISPLNGKAPTDAIDTIYGDLTSIAGMAVIDGKLYVNAEGSFTVNAYDMAGASILSAKGNGYSALPLNGYKGILLVKATDAEGNAKTAKFIVR